MIINELIPALFVPDSFQDLFLLLRKRATLADLPRNADDETAFPFRKFRVVDFLPQAGDQVFITGFFLTGLLGFPICAFDEL
jgi:hypothetical protein